MTAQLGMFEDVPPAVQKMPTEPILRTAEFSACATYRWLLRRAWGAGPAIAWAMLNPSVADATIDDPTIRRIMGFSFRWGFGSLVVGNIYPFRSPQPSALWAWRNNRRPGLGMMVDLDFQINAFTVSTAFTACSMHMAAWGTGVPSDDLDCWRGSVEGQGDPEVLYGPPAMGRGITFKNWHCLGVTQDGSPKHPLARGVHRVSDDSKPMLWPRP